LGRLSRRKFLYTGASAVILGVGYLSKDYWYPITREKCKGLYRHLFPEVNPTAAPTANPAPAESPIPSPEITPTPSSTETQTLTPPQPTSTGLPPGQHEIDAILRWNLDHPGIASQNPKLDLESWKLSINGEIKDPRTFSWRDFLNLPSIESISDFHCVEGWSVRNCRWHGVSFKSLVDSAKPTADAKYVSFSSADGYTTSSLLADLLKDNVLLAYRLNDSPLEESLGGPMRLVVPDKYGYKSAMWINEIRFTKTTEHGFWESRGYSDTADVWKDDRFSK
jgi:DMSO/TMAO reductase YedYZ molybdopterin-dependent catalytic subunit